MEQYENVEQEDSLDPQMQQQYEDVYHQMNMILDAPDFFQQTRKMLDEAHKTDMLVPEAGQMIVATLNRIEKETGPLPDDILLQLMEDLTTGVSDRYGLELTEEEEGAIFASAIGMWSREHPDRATEGMSPDEMQQLRGLVDEAGREFGEEPAPGGPAPGGTPQGGPQQGLMGGMMQ